MLNLICRLLALLPFLALASCSPTKAATAEAATEPAQVSLPGHRWEIIEVMGKDITAMRLQATPFLQFSTEAEGFRLSGSDGCNNLMGSYDMGDHGTIAFGQMAFTRKACPENGDINAPLVEALQKATNFTLSQDGQQLQLHRGKMAPFVRLRLPK